MGDVVLDALEFAEALFGLGGGHAHKIIGGELASEFAGGGTAHHEPEFGGEAVELCDQRGGFGIDQGVVEPDLDGHLGVIEGGGDPHLGIHQGLDFIGEGGVVDDQHPT